MSEVLSPITTLLIVGGYFLLLIGVSIFTSRGANNETFFTADRQSPWYLVAFGMIGATLSGVTLISIPGVVGKEGLNMNFSYMQMVLGYLLGYAVIAQLLMPIYYRQGSTTIYGYLQDRFGQVSYKMGAFYFLISRIIGASFRLFLVAIVLQNFVTGHFGIPFAGTVAITILLIWIYTYRGGIKTIVWTDTIQTTCILAAVVLSILAIGQSLGLGIGEMWSRLAAEGYTEMFYFEGGWSDPNNFFKQFFGGALMAIVMTGLDQDMMQKNLTCHTLRDAQKNMYTFSIILVFANVLFLSLGGLLYIYAAEINLAMPEKSDLLFPTLALEHLGPATGTVFILGLIAAAYSSADSALTSLTTSFCVDFLDIEKDTRPEEQKKQTRLWVHLGFSIVLFTVIVIFKSLNNDAIINELFTIAGYTYGPILGLFSFGIFTKRRVKDRLVWVVCLLSPVLSYLINTNSDVLLGGFKLGFLIIALNGLITFVGLWILSIGVEK